MNHFLSKSKIECFRFELRSAWFNGAIMKYAAIFEDEISQLSILQSSFLSSLYYSSLIYIAKYQGKFRIYRPGHFYGGKQVLIEEDLSLSLMLRSNKSLYEDAFMVNF